MLGKACVVSRMGLKAIRTHTVGYIMQAVYCHIKFFIMSHIFKCYGI